MSKQIHILLVEDNEGDILLTIEAFKEAQISNRISVVRNGESALLFLRKEGRFSEAETPDIVLLDIKLPGLNGIEVLSQIKNDDVLKVIPVVILTSSSSEYDILKAYNSYVNCYITKPVDLDQFIGVVRTLEDFWISVVQLPKSTNNE